MYNSADEAYQIVIDGLYSKGYVHDNINLINPLKKDQYLETMYSMSDAFGCSCIKYHWDGSNISAVDTEDEELSKVMNYRSPYEIARSEYDDGHISISYLLTDRPAIYRVDGKIYAHEFMGVMEEEK